MVSQLHCHGPVVKPKHSAQAWQKEWITSPQLESRDRVNEPERKGPRAGGDPKVTTDNHTLH